MFADRTPARGSYRGENESQRVRHRSFRFQRLFRNADQPGCQGPCPGRISSSGSAVAVALNLADVAFGTDTAGSIRVPAACCGVAGLKTTFGLVSTKGVYPISPEYLDTVGPLAKGVKGLVEGMKLLQADFDTLYAKAQAAKPSARQIRIGLLRVPGTDPAIDRAIEVRLVERGFQIVPLGEEFLKAWQQAQRDGNLMAAAACWYNNQAIRHEEGVGWRAQIAIWFGHIVFSHDYNDEAKRQRAIALRDEWRNTLRKVFQEVDAIALPVLRKSTTETELVFNRDFRGELP
jgi:amidase